MTVRLSDNTLQQYQAGFSFTGMAEVLMSGSIEILVLIKYSDNLRVCKRFKNFHIRALQTIVMQVA